MYSISVYNFSQFFLMIKKNYSYGYFRLLMYIRIQKDYVQKYELGFILLNFYNDDFCIALLLTSITVIRFLQFV